MLSLFVVLVLLSGYSIVLGQDACPQPQGIQSTCVCDLGTDQGNIDLTSLANTDNKPRFNNIERNGDGFHYSYNPCYGYLQGETDSACGGDLGKVSSCQFDPNGGDMFALGDPATETIYINKDTGLTYAQYTNGQDGRITQVNLICDPSVEEPQVTTDGDQDVQLTYVYYLRSKCACPGGCPHVTKESSSSAKGGVAPGIIGIVLIILLIPAIVAYFIVGMVIKKLLNKDTTGLDLIPQKDLWANLPFLIKDGCIFTFKPLVILIRNLISKNKGGGEYKSLD